MDVVAKLPFRVLAAVGVRENTTVSYGSSQPARMCRRRDRDAAASNVPRGQPAPSAAVRVGGGAASTLRLPRGHVAGGDELAVALALPRAACTGRARLSRAREEQWLLIEWPKSEPKPVHYWLRTLPVATPMKSLVTTVMGRGSIKRDCQELKSELGLHHYEGMSTVC